MIKLQPKLLSTSFDYVIRLNPKQTLALATAEKRWEDDIRVKTHPYLRPLSDAGATSVTFNASISRVNFTVGVRSHSHSVARELSAILHNFEWFKVGAKIINENGMEATVVELLPDDPEYWGKVDVGDAEQFCSLVTSFTQWKLKPQRKKRTK